MAGFYSMVTTAIIAAAIGFGGGVYWGEAEPANHFRAFLQSGVAAIHGTARSGDANLSIRPAEPLQAKTPVETPLIEARPDALAEPRTNAEAIAPAQLAPNQEGAVLNDPAASSSPASEDRENHGASAFGADSAPVTSTIETEAHAPVAPPIPAKPPRKKVVHKKPVNEVKEQPPEP